MDAAIALLETVLSQYDTRIERLTERRDRLRGQLALAQLHRAAVQPAPDVAGHIDLTDAALLGAPVCSATRR